MNDNMIRQWFAVDVKADPAAAEAVEYAFNVLESIGTEIDDFRKDKTDNLCIVGYFDRIPDKAAVRQALDEALTIYGIARDAIISTTVRAVADADWLAEWKKHWQPTAVGKFIIAPPWSNIPTTDKIVIRIEPNMAFGTGTHETTQLCLNAIGEDLRPGQSFLDVGTGTGILAIAAAKLSPLSIITACDTDADAVKIARENAAANVVADRIEFFEGSIAGETRTHAFVCANLTLDVITTLLPTLLEKAGEILLLSGVLAEQDDAVRAKLSRFQISNFKLEYAGEWLSVLIRK